jgi:hypothetical protein
LTESTSFSSSDDPHLGTFITEIRADSRSSGLASQYLLVHSEIRTWATIRYTDLVFWPTGMKSVLIPTIRLSKGQNSKRTLDRAEYSTRLLLHLRLGNVAFSLQLATRQSSVFC